MDAVSITDPIWFTSFPHRVVPRSEEWLAGVTLRCDEINEWASGTTASFLVQASKTKHALTVASFVIPSSFALAHLAQWLAVPEDDLIMTTYHAEIARLYGTSTPQAGLLNRDFLFHFCPVCIAESRTLRRTLTLPHLQCCPIHHVVLSSQCECGSNLTVEQLVGPGLTGRDYEFFQIIASLKTGTRQEMFSQRKRPFTCHRCRLDWSQFPRPQADPKRIALEQQILVWYEFFFAQDSRSLLKHALHLIQQTVVERKLKSVKRIDGKTVSVNFPSPEKSTLVRVIDILVSLNLWPDDLEADNYPLQ